MKLKSHIEEEIEKFDKLIIGDCFAGGIFQDNENQKMYTAGFKDGVKSARIRIREWLEQSLKSIAYKSKEDAFDVLMSCMPKSAENINTITPEDARKMLHFFVTKYWEEKEYKDE